MHQSWGFRATIAGWLVMVAAGSATAETRIRIMPPKRSQFALGQRFDLRVEATNVTEPQGAPPRGLRVTVDGVDVTNSNELDPGVSGERGAGGTGQTGGPLAPNRRAGRAPANSTNFFQRGRAFIRTGQHVISAQTSDGATASVTVTASAWLNQGTSGRRVRNVILFLGDGMGAAHRTAARIVSRGVTDGKANGPLAMDTMEVTGQVMTFSLNSVITDSAPGMAAYATGQKGNNNQVGVYPDNTVGIAFDNPRVEYLGELLRRSRGAGFNVGIVTTADVTDATPAGNAAHSADRNLGVDIADEIFDERAVNAVSVWMGGGLRNFLPQGTPGSVRKDSRNLLEDFRKAGYQAIRNATELRSMAAAAKVPKNILGLFHPVHMAVAFDKVGAGRYSDELADPRNADLRDQPMLDDMARLAIKSLSQNSPAGFYLMVEGASIDKQAHAADPERLIWDVIEFDRAVKVALDFARTTNTDRDPNNDTLVIVTADHESGGLGLIGVGNDRYAPDAIGKAVRDYAAVFRFLPEQLLNLMTNYEQDANGYPLNPDPSRKLLLGWAAAPDHYENWVSNRKMLAPTVVDKREVESKTEDVAVANPARDGSLPTSDNKTVSGRPITGFLVQGTIENGEYGCASDPQCPGDVSSSAQTISGHTASDVPLSATGPGSLQFTGTFDNSDVFLKILRAVGGRDLRQVAK